MTYSPLPNVQPVRKDSVYYPNLDGLRAIGAFIVLGSHFWYVKDLFGLPARQHFPIPGRSGVALFFALSGFLITSLLFRERDKTNTIRLKAFYIRRILRIWPLYYLTTILGLFVVSHIPFLKIPILTDKMISDMTWLNVLNTLLIIPNFTHLFIPYTEQRWSIIIEEMFYLIQPILVRTFRKIPLLIILFCVITFSNELFIGFVKVLRLDKHISSTVMDAIGGQLGYMGCIAEGCFFSALYRQREAFCKKYLFSGWTQFGILVVTAAFMTYSRIYDKEMYFDLRWYSFLFGILVLNAALNPTTIFRLEYAPLKFLGKISYGIYMYHMFCMGIALNLARVITPVSWQRNTLLVLLSVSITIFVSWLSYRYIESFFLGLGRSAKAHPNNFSRQKLVFLRQAPSRQPPTD